MAPTILGFVPNVPVARSLEERQDDDVPAKDDPLAGAIMSVILTMAAITVLTFFISQRALPIKVWSRLPYVVWLVFAIYIDSYLFVFATSILQHAVGVNTSLAVCSGAILLCLVCYVTTKVFIYLFLVEKAYIIRGSKKPRMKSKLYLFNSFGMVGVYTVVAIVNFVFRITKIENGVCIIGMEDVAMIPLISFDAVVNVYLTILFLIPLKNLYSFKHFQKTPANIRLRTVATRTFVGAVCTLISSIVNLSVLMALGGEPGWVCLMCCNADILFSAIVIQWITSRDNAGTATSTSRRAANETYDGRDGAAAAAGAGGANGVAFSPRDPKSGGGATGLGGGVEVSLSSTVGGRRSSMLDHQTHHHHHHRGRQGSLSSSADDASLDAIKGGSESTSELTSMKRNHPAGGVVVTTTIKRESKPSSTNFEDDRRGGGGGGGEGGFTTVTAGGGGAGTGRMPPARPLSVAVEGRPEGFMRQSARTKISAGANHN